MECYATPWPLWRESRNLKFFIEPSFALGARAPLSISLSLFVNNLLSYLFPFGWFHVRWHAQGLAISACTQLIGKRKESKLEIFLKFTLKFLLLTPFVQCCQPPTL